MAARDATATDESMTDVHDRPQCARCDQPATVRARFSHCDRWFCGTHWAEIAEGASFLTLRVDEVRDGCVLGPDGSTRDTSAA